MAIETLATIARKTQCSVSTVSRVLGGMSSKYRISEATRQKIIDAARECNYTPSALAKGLRKGKTDSIGLLIPGIDDSFFSEMASVIISEARTMHYTAIVVDTQEDEKNESDGLNALFSRNVDGIIAVPCGDSRTLYEKAKRADVPLVVIDRYFDGVDDLSYVTTDNYLGSSMAVEHLIANGHKNILCVQGNPSAQTGKERVRGYVDTMGKHGLSDNVKVVGDEFSARNSYEAVSAVLSSTHRPTAILSLSNKILMGCIQAISESSLQIPEDISVVSYDDDVMFNYMEPKITCVAQPIREIGLLSLQLLAKKMAGESDMSHIFLSPAMVMRQSVKKI